MQTANNCMFKSIEQIVKGQMILYIVTSPRSTLGEKII